MKLLKTEVSGLYSVNLQITVISEEEVTARATGVGLHCRDRQTDEIFF